MHGNAKNIRGKTFGYLKVKEHSDHKSSQGVVWTCECLICGRLITATTKELTSGHRISCGSHPELAHERSKIALEKTRDNGVLMASFNKSIQKNNSSGVRGVSSYQLRSGTIKYEAKIQVNGNQYKKRGFKTIEEATKYRKKLEAMYLPKK